MDELNKRIVDIMNKYGYSKSTFAALIGVSLPLITHITSGRNKPGVDLLQRVAEQFPDISLEWLLLGTGEMTVAKQPKIDLSPLLHKIDVLYNQINNSLTLNQTMKSFHKILIDELKHLSELDAEIEVSTSNLLKVKNGLENITQEVENLNNT